MHRKEFSCFSIESLIGRSEQPRRTQVAGDRDSSVEQTATNSTRRPVSSSVDRTWTGRDGHAPDGCSSTQLEARLPRNSPTSLSDRPTTAWRRCHVADNFLPTSDGPTRQCHTSDRYCRTGTRRH